MAFDEDYLRLLGRVNRFTRATTGTSIVDSYFGPANLSPEKPQRAQSEGPETLMTDLKVLLGAAEEIEDELRRAVIASDLASLEIVVRWLSGERIPYIRLVEGIFGITPRKFSQSTLDAARGRVEDAGNALPGSSTSEKILSWEEESKLSGENLKTWVDEEVVTRTLDIERLFERHVFTHLSGKLENAGVIYKTVTGEPWGAYNYYKGNFTSVNTVNLDFPVKRHSFLWTLCHEYEHHVANLAREQYYRGNRALDLAAVLLHTRGCIISEGTADCAKEFLGLRFGEYDELIESLATLRRMVGLNAAYLLNVEDADGEAVAEYIASEGFRPVAEARKSIRFPAPLTPDGRPNFWKPYLYTYFFGRRDYVLPTFRRAQETGRVKEFLQILYSNPYSRSTATWATAFSGI